MATPTMIIVPRGLGKVLAASLPIEMSETLRHLDKVRWPSMSAMMSLRNIPVAKTTFNHLQDEKIPNWVVVDGADTALTAINVSNGDRCQEGDLLYNPRTGRRMSIDNDEAYTAGSDAVSVKAMGGIETANAIGDQLLIYGNAREEGDEARAANSTKKVKKTFYTQWWRHTSELTWDEADTAHYAVDDERLYQIEQITRKHKEEIANSGWFGISSADLANGPTTHAMRSAGGMDEFITSNVWAVPNGHLTRPGLFDAIGQVLQYNKDASQLVMATSFRVMNIINGWGLDVLQTKLGDGGTFGMEFDAIRVGGKKLVLVHEPVFDEQEDLQGRAYIYNLNNVAYRPFSGKKNRDTQLYPNIKTDNNIHLMTDEVATQAGFEFSLEQSFMKITGIEY